MNIGGLQKTSLLDYPDCISAIIWTIGCNFRCPFCYNRQLVFEKTEVIPEEEVLSFLKKRKGLLEGVVITGGEPLLQEDVVAFIEKVKTFGYLVKVDTNGMFPDKLKELIDKKLVDYVALDVKAPQKKYDQLAGVKVDVSLIERSVDIIKNGAVAYEFRTTFVPGFLEKEDIGAIAKWLEGADQYFLQQFRYHPPLVSSKLDNVVPYADAYFYETLEAIKPYFKACGVRGV
jgi:pyruvate formate lyase activating enzyme